jgi:hypothetical protein
VKNNIGKSFKPKDFPSTLSVFLSRPKRKHSLGAFGGFLVNFQPTPYQLKTSGDKSL